MPKNPTGGPINPQDKPVPESTEASTADGAPQASPAEAAPHAAAERGGRLVAERKKQFLVAPRQPAGVMQPMAMAGLPSLQLSAVEQALRNNPEIDVVRTVAPRSALGTMSDGSGITEGVLVARMTDQKAQALQAQGMGWLMVERDHHLSLFEPVVRQPGFVNAVAPVGGPALQASVLVLDKDGAPMAEAEVSLFGSLLPASGVTGADGMVHLTLYGETVHTISALYVKPKADHWSFYQRDPDISTDEPNVVALRALSAWPSLSGFPGQSVFNWGQRVMRLDKLPPTYRGRGIKIAVIDSGAATSHENLKSISAGFDIIGGSPNTWNQDTLGHGSHCAGVIAGGDPTCGIRGFAPEAEIHVCKLFPGGQVSQLIEALEYCIEKQIDVVNLSLGGAPPSEPLEQQIMRAKRAGVACIAAAGNSGGPVQYPASSPNVLAVAAIGKFDEFPPDSYHAETMDGSLDAQGFFPAKFSCFGPQVDVCAPGVAIVSSVPPNNFAAWDGTSMAAPHVTGLAALVLAHHPDFQAVRTRGPERVERLFQIIKMSSRRLGDPAHFGFGLPDAPIAVGLPLAQGMPMAPIHTMGTAAGTAPAMLASLVGRPMMDPGLAAYAGLAQQQHPMSPAAAVPFGIPLSGLRPAGW